MARIFNADIIEKVVFDVDGTFYIKNKEYTSGRGSIQTAHDFFRFLAFQELTKNPKMEREIFEELVSEYQRRVKNGTLKEAVSSVPQKIKESYLELVKKYGANGKVFPGEFNTRPNFFQELYSYTDFASILPPDTRLQQTFQYLKQEGYDLGIFTTDVFSTTKAVAQALGFSLDDFRMNTGDEYPILCAENVAEKKPSTEGFERLKQVFQIDDPQKILYVGDHSKKDVEVPLKCGLQAAHVIHSGTLDTSIATMSIGAQDAEYAKLGSVYALTNLL